VVRGVVDKFEVSATRGIFNIVVCLDFSSIFSVHGFSCVYENIPCKHKIAANEYIEIKRE